MFYSPSRRKRPHCHTCGTPMAGHKRENNIPICPVRCELGLNSQPPSSLRGLSPIAESSTCVSNNASIDIPVLGPFRRRNPSWAEPAHRSLHRDPSLTCSLVSTDIIDNNERTIDSSFRDSHDNRELDALLARDHRELKLTVEPRRDVAYSQLQQIQPSAVRPVPLKRSVNSSWIAQNRMFVQQIVELCQKPPAVEGPRAVAVLPLIMAGIVGGCVVLLGTFIFLHAIPR